MSFEPNERQALLLWTMITAATPQERQPMMSAARPKLATRERNALVKNGFLECTLGKTEKGHRANFLAVTDKAWEWASHAHEVEIMPSKFASSALQGLLRRLVPFLERREIALAELFRDEEPQLDEATVSPEKQRAQRQNRPPRGTSPAAPTVREPAGDSLHTQVEQACLSLAGGAKKSRVRLSALRRALPAISRRQLDAALIVLQRERRLVLYREDNTPALTAEDHAAALVVGDSPRHLVYLEA
jgi:hypothetical protein